MIVPTAKTPARLLLASALTFLSLLNVRCSINEVNVPPFPVVKVISPTSTSHILDTATIQVQASDDKGVTRVEIYIDGKLPQGGRILYIPYKYDWDTSLLPDSSVHQIYAKAFDTDSNSTTSSVVTVTVYKFRPTNLTAILVGDTLVSLSWQDNSSKETGFEVFEQSPDSGYFIAARLAPNTTTTGIAGTYLSTKNYTFYVRAIMDSVTSKYSNPVTVSPVVTAPSELTASAINDTLIILSWQNRLHSIAQYIEIDTAQVNGPFGVLKNVPATMDSIALNGAYTLGTPYRFRLRGWTAHNNYSSYSNIASAYVILPAPSGLKGTVVNQFAIQLSWNDNSSSEKGFSIERETATTAFAEIAEVGPNVTTFVNSGLDTNVSYTYRVRAFTGLNTSGYSGFATLRYQLYYFEEQSIQADDRDIGGVAFVGNSNNVLSGGSANTIKIWDATTGALVSTLTGNSAPVTSLAVNSQGTILVTGTSDGKITVWDIPSGSVTLTIPAFPVSIKSVSLSPDGQYIASSSADSSMIKVWKVSDGSLLWSIVGHTSLVNATVYSPDGTTIFSGSDDQHVKTWNASDGTLVRNEFVAWNYFKSLAVNSAANMIVAGSSSQSNPLSIWQLTTGNPLTSFTPGGSIPGAYAVIFSADGTTLACGYDDYFVRVWNVTFRSLIAELSGHHAQVHSVSFNSGATLLASGSSDGVVKIWRWKKLWR